MFHLLELQTKLLSKPKGIKTLVPTFFQLICINISLSSCLEIWSFVFSHENAPCFSFYFVRHQYCYKGDSRLTIESLRLNFMMPTQDLTHTYSFSSPRNRPLNQSLGNQLVRTSEVICPTDLCGLLKGVTLLYPIHS